MQVTIVHLHTLTFRIHVYDITSIVTVILSVFAINKLLRCSPIIGLSVYSSIIRPTFIVYQTLIQIGKRPKTAPLARLSSAEVALAGASSFLLPLFIMNGNSIPSTLLPRKRKTHRCGVKYRAKLAYKAKLQALRYELESLITTPLDAPSTSAHTTAEGRLPEG